MARQVLHPDRTTRQGDQVERLSEQIHQHRIAGQAGTAGAGQHPSALDARHHDFDLSAAQHIDQHNCLQIIGALGEGNQGTKGHGLRSKE
ncbi:hypothetical protein D3C72_1991650 [compost metagenome]